MAQPKLNQMSTTIITQFTTGRGCTNNDIFRELTYTVYWE